MNLFRDDLNNVLLIAVQPTTLDPRGLPKGPSLCRTMCDYTMSPNSLVTDASSCNIVITSSSAYLYILALFPFCFIVMRIANDWLRNLLYKYLNE